MCLCKHTVPEAASSGKAALSGPAGRSGLQTPRPPAGPPALVPHVGGGRRAAAPQGAARSAPSRIYQESVL